MKNDIVPLPEHTCPVCHKVMDVVMMLDDQPQPPEVGDISICGGCLSVNVFKADGQLRLATSEECEENLPEWVKLRMMVEQRRRQRVF